MYSELVNKLRTESLYKDKATLEIMDLCMEAAAAIDSIEKNSTIESIAAENAEKDATIAALQSELSKLREVTTAAWLQLHTETFSTNKAVSEMAKFIIAYLPQPPSTAEVSKDE